MGCAAFTPSVVSLANELEGQPFHLIASYNQNGSAAHALEEVFQNGLSLQTSNVTATLQSGHPNVSGVKYVPYYLLFDEHGDLVHHHQGGPYHGGDNFELLDRVRGMLRELPEVYLGQEPYVMQAKLAGTIALAKNLPAGLKQLTEALAANPDDAELQRLATFVERYAKSRVANFHRTVARDPKAAIKQLAKDAKFLGKSPLGADVLALLATTKDAKTKQRYTNASKALLGIESKWNKLKPTRGNGGEVRNPLDAVFRQENASKIAKLTAALEELATEYAGQPAALVAQQMLKALGN